MNQIGDRGILELAPALAKNETMQYLNLTVCQFLSFTLPVTNYALEKLFFIRRLYTNWEDNSNDKFSSKTLFGGK